MDTQVSELIDRIKSEGVEQAEKQAKQIVASAEEQAQAILTRAREQAAGIVDEAKQDRSRQEAAGREALRQAARDTILTVQAQLTAIFKQIVEEATRGAMDESTLKSAVTTVVTSWAKGEEQNIDVLLSASDLGKLEGSLRAELAEALGRGVDIKGSPAVSAGFRIESRDTGVYYDFTSAAIADALASYVTPRLAETVREAAKDA
jgi:V/A-type H+-transporting ATPase subunit E